MRKSTVQRCQRWRENRAIAYLLESKGVINGNVEEALDFYVKMCSAERHGGKPRDWDFCSRMTEWIHPESGC